MKYIAQVCRCVYNLHGFFMFNIETVAPAPTRATIRFLKDLVHFYQEPVDEWDSSFTSDYPTV